MDKIQFAQSVKAKYPEYKDVDDTLLADKMLEKYPEYRDRIVETTPKAPATQKNTFLDALVNPQTPTTPTPIDIKGAYKKALPAIQDTTVSFLSGIYGAKEGLTGIADILTGGRVGKFVEKAERKVLGSTSQDMREFLSTVISEEGQAKKKKVEEASGFVGTAEELIKNPTVIANMISESLPSMLAGGVVSKSLGALLNLTKYGLKISPTILGTIGEGAISGGSTAEQARQESETGLLTGKQATVSGVSGALTSLFGGFGGKIAQKLGVADIDTILAGGANEATKKSIITQALKGAMSESAFEELPQSMQEQIASNINAGKQWDEGVAEAGATGAITAFTMGGAFSGVSQAMANKSAKDLEKMKQQIIEDNKDNPMVQEFVKQEQAVKDILDFVEQSKETETPQQIVEMLVEKGIDEATAVAIVNEEKVDENRTLASDIADKLSSGRSINEVALEMSDMPIDDAISLVSGIAEKQTQPSKKSDATKELNALADKVDASVLKKTATDLQNDFDRVQSHIDEQVRSIQEKVDSLKERLDSAEPRSTEKKRLKVELENARGELRDAESSFYDKVAGNAKAFRSFVVDYAKTQGLSNENAEKVADQTADIVTGGTSNDTIENIVSTQIAQFSGEINAVPTKNRELKQKTDKKVSKVDIKVGDTFDTQGKTNMKGKVTVTSIEGRTVKFRDEEGTDYAGMENKTVRELVEGGSWNKVEAKEKQKEKVKKVVEKKKVEKKEEVKEEKSSTKAIEKAEEILREAWSSEGVVEARGKKWKVAKQGGVRGVQSYRLETEELAKKGETASFTLGKDALEVTTDKSPIDGFVNVEEISAVTEEKFVDILRSKYPSVSISLFEGDDTITLSKIVVPQNERGTGLGSKVMVDIVEYADKNNKKIVLTPSKDYGASSVARLISFYKRFDFVENKGKNKDFSTRETMYRLPAKESLKEDKKTVETQAKQEKKEAPAVNLEDKKSPIERNTSIVAKVQHGEATLEEYRAGFEDFVANKEEIQKLLSKETKADLMKRLGRFSYVRASDSKNDIVEKVLTTMVSRFTLGKTVSYSPMGKNAYEEAVRKIVDNVTQEDLNTFADEIKANTEALRQSAEAYKKAITNPETLEEFKTFLKVNNNDVTKLTPEQLKSYDDLLALENKAKREKMIADKGNVSGVDAGTDLTVTETKNTKTGEDIFVVKLSDRVEKETYQALNTSAKKLGGYYSRFSKGFLFKDKASAEQFVQVGKGESVKTDAPVLRAEERKNATAQKLTEMATSLREKANEQLNKERLTNTARRANMASGQEENARIDLAMADTMENLAKAIESREAVLLDGVTARTQIEELDAILRRAHFSRSHEMKFDGYAQKEDFQRQAPVEEDVAFTEKFPHSLNTRALQEVVQKGLKTSGSVRLAKTLQKALGKIPEGELFPPSFKGMEMIAELTDSLDLDSYNPIKHSVATFKRLKAMGVTSTAELRAMLREYLTYRGTKQEADKVKQLERELVGKKVGFDFFPTPTPVAERMVNEANVTAGMKVLEPSAGNGNIADVMKAKGANVDVLEISGELRKVLEAKGYNVVGNDFLSYTEGGYDAIVMNPPFSNNQDIKHIQHAYTLLKNGGTISAIAGEGAFFRSGKTETEFRNWLDEIGATVEKLDENTFTDKTLLATTGANARLITITKNETDPTTTEEEEARKMAFENSKYVFENDEAPQIVNYIAQNGDQVAYRTPTTMANFPDHLKKRTLFNSVKPYWYAQERPKRGALMQELYDTLTKDLELDTKKIMEQNKVVRPLDSSDIPFKLRKYKFDTDYSKKDAIAYLENLQQRFKIDFDVHFVDSILADYRVDPLKKTKEKRFAEGVYIDNTIAIAEDMASYTAEHESVHLTLANMYRIEPFRAKGLSKKKVMQAMANELNLVLNDQNSLEVEEQIAYDFELYMHDKKAWEKERAKRLKGATPETILDQFYEILKNLVMKFAEAIGITEGDIIKNYYEILTEGVSVNEEMLRFQNRGWVKSFTEDGELSIYSFERQKQKGLLKTRPMSDVETRAIVDSLKTATKQEQYSILDSLSDEDMEAFARNPISFEVYDFMQNDVVDFWTRALGNEETVGGKFKLREENDAYLQKVKKNFNELVEKQQKLVEDTTVWKEDIKKGLVEKASIAQVVDETDENVKTASRFTNRTKKPVGELTKAGERVVTELGFKNKEEAQKEISEYLMRKTQLVQTANQLRAISRKISEAKKQGKEGRKELRDVARRIKLRKKLLEQKEFYVNMGKGRGVKEALTMVQKRGRVLRDTQDLFQISDAKAKEIIGTQRIHLMSEKKFNEFLTYFSNRAQMERSMLDAREEVQAILFEKQFQKEDNLRKSLGLPPLNQMTEAQATMYAGVLYQYQFGDTFLTKREMETSARTKYEEIKTERELLQKIEEVAGIPAGELKNIKVSTTDRGKNWLQLSRKNLFFNWLVGRKMMAKTKEIQQVYAFRRQLDTLTRKARKSRSGEKDLKEKIWDFVAPTDKEVFEALNTGDFSKLTMEEKALADFLTIMFRAKYDKLKENFKDFKGRENYVTHMSRDFFETLRDTGSVKEGIEMFREEQKETENALEILAGQTGEILAFDKFLPYMLKRSEKITPSNNVSRIALTYFTATTRKELLDEFIPEAMLTLHGYKVLTGQTAKGLDMKPFLETFTKEYLNDAKGRKIDFVTRQGSDVDTALMAFISWISFKYIGGNPILAFMNLFGDLIALSAGTTMQQKGLAFARMLRRSNVEDNIRGLIGHNPLVDILNTQTGLAQRILPFWFSLMSSTSYLANKFTVRGLLTEEEFKSGIVSDERILEMARQINKFKLTDSYGRSMIGNTTAGKASLQFKTWAVPFLLTAIEDIKAVAKDPKFNNPQTKKDAIELARIVLIGGFMYAVVQVISNAVGGDDDEDNYLWKQIENNLNTIYGILAMPFNLDENLVPVLVSEVIKVSSLLKQIALMEQYQKPSNGNYAGDYKALETLKKIVVPTGATRIFNVKEDNRTPKETLIEESVKSGEFDAEEIAMKTSMNWGEKTESQRQNIINNIRQEHTVLTKYPNSKVVEIVLGEKNNKDRVVKLLKYSEKVGVETVYEELKTLMKDKELYANQEKYTGAFISAELFRDFQLARKKLQNN